MCECQGCGHAAVTALDFLEDVPEPLIAISRDNEFLAVGKFSGAALEQLCRPGDKVLNQWGETGTYRPPENTSSTSSAEEQPPPTDIEILIGTRLRHPSGLVTRVVRIEDGLVYYDEGGRIQLTRLQELVRAGGTQVLPRFSEQTPPFSGEGHKLGGMELDGME